MNEDRIEGSAKQVLGQVQETIGGVANDDTLQAKGLLNQAGGIVQDGYGQVRDTVKAIIDEAPATAQAVLDAGRAYYRRGSSAVTRSLNAEGTGALLAAGAVGAAVAWLLFGRRGGSSRR